MNQDGKLKILNIKHILNSLILIIFPSENIFKKNLEKINSHNEKYNNGDFTYSLGVTKFADWVIKKLN